MQNLLRILPVVVVIAIVGAAIVYVRSGSIAREASAEVKPAAPVARDLRPQSDRYGADSPVRH